jgi:hypothetical protein
VQIRFSVVLILLAHLENAPKMFYRSLRIFQKYLIAFRECVKSLSAYTEITAIFEMFYLYEVVYECGKSTCILACTEFTLKIFKRIRRKRQEDFAVYGEYADRHKTEPILANFLTKSHATVPLNKKYFHGLKSQI